MSGRVVIVADRLFDGYRFVEPARVSFEGGVVVAVGADVTDLPSVRLDGMSLLPGFVDCHQHLVFDGNGTYEEQVADRSDAELRERARLNARRALEGGVTTLRDLGDRNFVTLELRNDPSLPTILCSGPPITPPGGHCWFLNGECDSRDALVAAIAERADRGCDVVKIMATGGHGTPAAPAWQSQFTVDDLRVAVEEAHRLGMPVAAHCHGVQGISDSVDAGVDTIEHCSFTSEDWAQHPGEELLRRVAASQIPLSATFGRCPDVPIQLPPGGLPAWFTTMFESMARVRELGAPIVVGTDAGIAPHKPHDVAPHAIEPLLTIGTPPHDALTALTAAGAVAIGAAGKGHLTTGNAADLVAVKGDLFTDVRSVANVEHVWLRGQPIR
jgi:imidazolonepropionase-like amidohydrolase